VAKAGSMNGITSFCGNGCGTVATALTGAIGVSRA
jgi:hypothetical protein